MKKNNIWSLVFVAIVTGAVAVVQQVTSQRQIEEQAQAIAEKLKKES